MEFHEFMNTFESTFMQKKKYWRRGQTLFNVLVEHRNDLSEQIRGDVFIDPFYDDEKTSKCINFIKTNW